MNPPERLALILTLLGGLAAGPAPAAPPSLSPTSQLATAESTVNLPGVVVHGGEHKSLEVPGQISLAGGILEFLAVQPGGREYESLFTLDARPSMLQAALLLIGCAPGPLPAKAKKGEKPGDRLLIDIEWQTGHRPHRLPVEQLLLDRKTRKPLANVAWIFTGSEFVKSPDGHETFQADAEQAFIALWDSPSIPINLSVNFGNPYQGENQGLEINTPALPPKDTPIKLLIRKSE